ncbi:RING finger domain-containing protein [Endozoicomonas sp. ONNA2]|uniref:RING finger domain-containing protein n=1 Tax=Endozoicomonas sp. ONNA2 TaxID=2828741 RepID=UPI00214822FB|nr:RING finger domain-containing protein [Endozoicomonas sp. ONNA2]
MISGNIPSTVQRPQTENLEEDKCSICLDAFGDYENAITTRACKHTFHIDCIENSLKFEKRLHNRAICPVCRGDLSGVATALGITSTPEQNNDTGLLQGVIVFDRLPDARLPSRDGVIMVWDFTSN